MVWCGCKKPLEFWFQIYDQNKNFSLDLKESENCDKVTEGVEDIMVYGMQYVNGLLRTIY